MSDWIRVTKQHPCPICEKPDWCGVSEDGAVAMCQRVESSKRIGDAGWLHRLTDDVKRDLPVRRPPKPVREVRDMGAYAVKCAQRLGDPIVLSKALGLNTESLVRMGAGWNGDSYTFPMRDATGRVIGIRTRTRDGLKFCVKGSHNGLFVPRELSDLGEVLIVCEGPTDTAAIIGLGMDAIGRPSNTGGETMLIAWIKNRAPRLVVLLVDRDESGSIAERLTMNAATRLAGNLRCETRRLRPATPAKDARDWVRSGATARLVRSAIASACAI